MVSPSPTTKLMLMSSGKKSISTDTVCRHIPDPQNDEKKSHERKDSGAYVK